MLERGRDSGNSCVKQSSGSWYERTHHASFSRNIVDLLFFSVREAVVQNKGRVMPSTYKLVFVTLHREISSNKEFATGV